MDALDVLRLLIEKNDLEALRSLGRGLGPLFNRRNSAIIWHALIETAAKRISRGESIEKAMGGIQALVGAGLDPNGKLDSGNDPLSLAWSREPELAAAIGLLPGVNLNQEIAKESTPLLKWSHDRGGSAKRWEAQQKWLESGKIDLLFKDQGMRCLLAALTDFAVKAKDIATEQTARDAAKKLLTTLVRTGVDINAARYAKVDDPVSINTPLAFFLKKLKQWDESSGGLGTPAAQYMSATVTEWLLDLGADPGLQLEPGARMALMDVCSKARFAPGLANRLEKSALEKELTPAKKTAGVSQRQRL